MSHDIVRTETKNSDFWGKGGGGSQGDQIKMTQSGPLKDINTCRKQTGTALHAYCTIACCIQHCLLRSALPAACTIACCLHHCLLPAPLPAACTIACCPQHCLLPSALPAACSIAYCLNHCVLTAALHAAYNSAYCYQYLLPCLCTSAGILHDPSHTENSVL
jgi:hypothetical protein